MIEEKDLWSGSPSQIINFWHFILCLLIIYIPIAIWKYLVVKNMKYELTSQRLRNRYGVLNKHIDELELYRVKDYEMNQPLFLRLFGLSNIVLYTADKTDSIIIIRAVPDGEKLRELIRSTVQDYRASSRTREVSVE